MGLMGKDLLSCHIFNKAFWSSIGEHSAKSFKDEKPNRTLTGFLLHSGIQVISFHKKLSLLFADIIHQVHPKTS